DLARLDDEEPGVAVAGCKELFPGVEAPEHGQWAAAQRGQLALAELREGDAVRVLLGHLTTSDGGRHGCFVTGGAPRPGGGGPPRPDRRSPTPSAPGADRTRRRGGPRGGAWRVACRPGGLSQQPTWPQLRPRRS